MPLEKKQVNIPISGGVNEDTDDHLLDPPYALVAENLEADRYGALNTRVQRVLTKNLSSQADTLVVEPQITVLGKECYVYSPENDDWNQISEPSYRGIHVEKALPKTAGCFTSIARAGAYVCVVESHQTLDETLDGGGGGWYVFQEQQYRWESFYAVYAESGETVVPKTRIEFNSRDVGQPRVAAVDGRYFLITGISAATANGLWVGAVDTQNLTNGMFSTASVDSATNKWYVFGADATGEGTYATGADSNGVIFRISMPAGVLTVTPISAPAYVYGTFGPFVGVYEDPNLGKTLLCTTSGYGWTVDSGGTAVGAYSGMTVWSSLVNVSGDTYYATDGTSVWTTTASGGFAAVQTSVTSPTAVSGLWTDGTDVWIATKFTGDSSYSFTYANDNALYNGPEAELPDGQKYTAICQIIKHSVEARDKATGLFYTTTPLVHEVVAVLPTDGGSGKQWLAPVIPSKTYDGRFIIPVGGGSGDGGSVPRTAPYWDHPWNGNVSHVDDTQRYGNKPLTPVFFDPAPSRRAKALVFGGTLVSSGLLHLVTNSGVSELSYLPNFGRETGNYLDPPGYAAYSGGRGVANWEWAVGGQSRRTAGWMLGEVTADASDATGWSTLSHLNDLTMRFPFMRNNRSVTNLWYVTFTASLAGVQNAFWTTRMSDPVSSADWYELSNAVTFHASVVPATDPAEFPWDSYSSPKDWWKGGELHPQYAPPFHHMASDGRRVFGVDALDRTRIWYSKYFQDGIAPEFNEALTVEFDGDAGDIMGIGTVDSTIYVLTKTRVYRLVGAGADNTGRGQNYDVRRVQTDTGCASADSIVNTDQGLFFQGVNGFYHIDRSTNVQYLGRATRDTADSTVVSSVQQPNKKQVTWVYASKTVTYNYDKQVWTTSTESLSNSDVVYDTKTDTTYSLDDVTVSSANIHTDTGAPVSNCRYQSAWIKPAGLQGYSRTWFVHLLFEAVAGAAILVRIYTDYDETQDQSTTYTVDAANASPGQLRIRLEDQKCQALRVDITHTSNGGAFTLKGLSITAGLEPAGSAVLTKDQSH